MSSAIALHIVAGTLALMSGAAALFFRKGERLHRAAGTVFFLSMLALTASGIYVAFTLPAWLSAFGGIFTAYLVATGWMAVKRKEGETGLFEWAALLFALTTAAGCLGFGLQVAHGALTEYAAGAPIPASTYYVFAGLALLAAMGDARLLLRKGITGAQRIARHLWRMCLALWIAASSFFLGQPQVFPAAIRETPGLLYAPVLAVIILMLFWLFRVLFTGWHRKAQSQVPDRTSDMRTM